MSDRFNAASLDPTARGTLVTQGRYSPLESRDLMEARNEEEISAQMESLSPERAGELNQYYNRSLESIDQVRFPFQFPDLSQIQSAGAVSGAQGLREAQQTREVQENKSVNPLGAQSGTQGNAVQEMIAGDTPVKATEGEISSLSGSLSVVSPEVLAYAQQKGVKFQPVHEGDDITALKVLRPQKPGALEKKLPAMEAFGKKLNENVETKFDSKLRELEKQRNELAEKLRKDRPGNQPPPDKNASIFSMMANPEPSSPELEKLDMQILDLEREKGKFIADEIGKSGLAADIKPYSIDIPSGNGFSGAGISAMLGRFPQSMEGMAEAHGAKTPEEKEEFYNAMKALNGDKLEKARKQALENDLRQFDAIENPDERSKVKAEISKGYAKQYEGHPEKMPMSYQDSVVLVPNTYYYHKPGAKEGDPPIRLDYHDYGTLNDWTDPQTGKAHNGKLGEGRTSVTNGQYFHLDGVNRILIRDFKMGGTTSVHELGHAIEANVEKDDPAFYKEWQANLKKAYDNVGKEGGTRQISDYSRENLKEYLAEGFMKYYEDPKLLKSNDPALYSRVEEMINRASSLGKK
jgi:hypothetical protein